MGYHYQLLSFGGVSNIIDDSLQDHIFVTKPRWRLLMLNTTQHANTCTFRHWVDVDNYTQTAETIQTNTNHKFLTINLF